MWVRRKTETEAPPHHASSGHVIVLHTLVRDSLYVPSVGSWVTTLNSLPQSWRAGPGGRGGAPRVRGGGVCSTGG